MWCGIWYEPISPKGLNGVSGLGVSGGLGEGSLVGCGMASENGVMCASGVPWAGDDEVG